MADKSKIRVEYEKDGPMIMVRPHRQFFKGTGAVAKPILVEIEYEDTETLFVCALVDASEGTPGRSARCEVEGLLFTVEPHLFGSDADRTASGRLTVKECPFGQWTCLNLETL
jgi:hypothetical protein